MIIVIITGGDCGSAKWIKNNSINSVSDVFL